MVESVHNESGRTLDVGEAVSRGDTEREHGDLGQTRACASYASPEDLFRTQYSHLVRVLTVVAGDQDVAADAVQDAFVQLCVHWSSVKAHPDQVGWLRRVSVNRLHDRRRSLGRRTAALLRLHRERSDVEGLPSGADLDLATAIRALPPRQRKAMALFYTGDLTIAEVAEAMGISEGAVNRHLHRGREGVRRYMEVT
jgi:RNA polymerase sigma-70 factor (ECF subfamily)